MKTKNENPKMKTENKNLGTKRLTDFIQDFTDVNADKKVLKLITSEKNKPTGKIYFIKLDRELMVDLQNEFDEEITILNEFRSFYVDDRKMMGTVNYMGLLEKHKNDKDKKTTLFFIHKDSHIYNDDSKNVIVNDDLVSVIGGIKETAKNKKECVKVEVPKKVEPKIEVKKDTVKKVVRKKTESKKVNTSEKLKLQKEKMLMEIAKLKLQKEKMLMEIAKLKDEKKKSKK